MTTFIEDLEQPNKALAMLFEWRLDSGTKRFWTGNRNLIVEGQSFLGVSNLVLNLAIRQSLSFADLSASFRFRGGQNEIILVALNEDYQNRQAYAWLATLTSTGAFSNRALVVVGRLININIDTSSDNVITDVEIEGVPAFLRGLTGLKLSSADQKGRVKANDTIFDFLEASRNNPPRWGT